MPPRREPIRRAPPKKKRPYTLPDGPRGDSPATREEDFARAEAHKRTPSYRRAIRQTRREQRPAPVAERPPAFRPGPPAPGDVPFARARRQAARRAARARRRMPNDPRLPRVPSVKPENLTAKQRRAAIDLGRQGLTRARGEQSAQSFYETASPADRANLMRLARLERYEFEKLVERRTRQGYRHPRGVQLRANPPDTRVGLPFVPGTINLTAITQAAQALGEDVVAGRGAGAQLGGLGTAAERVGSDIVNFPVEAARGIYETGRAGVDLAGHVPGTPWKGDTRRAKALLDALGEGAVGQLVQGDPAGALEAFKEHPVYALLDVTAVGGIAGRAAGIGMRSGALGSRAARRASTAREDLTLVPGTNQRIARSYSGNQLVKEAQLARERSQRRQGLDPNVAQESIVPFRGRSHALNREVDEFAAQAEGMRRRGREEVGREARDLAPSRRGVERDVVAAAVEGRLGARVPESPAEFRKALERERDRLQDVYRAERKDMSRSALLANREQVKALDKAIGDPKTLARHREVFAAADEYETVAGRIERDLIRQGALDPDQATAAKLRTYAVAQMGARYDKSQRAPEELKARHETARQVEQDAKGELDRATAGVRQAAAKRDRIVGGQTVKRGQDAQKGPLKAFYVGEKRFESRKAAEAYAAAEGGQVRSVARTVAEAKRTGELDRATRALAAAKANRRRAEAKWKQARRDRVKSNPRKYTSGLVDKDGNRLSTAQIVEHIRANGGRMPAFLGHRRDTRGARSFFVNWFDRRKTAEGSGTRTGEAARTGAYAADFRALVENLVRQQGVASAVGTFDAFVGRFGMKAPNGKPFTPEQAAKVAEDVEEATGVPMVPVNAVPARYDPKTRAAILEGQRSGSMPEWVDSLVERRLAESLEAPSSGKPTVVLVPAHQMERFREHQTTNTGTAGKVGRAFTSTFRSTVLPFSTKWLTGNVGEAELRMLVAGVNPITDPIRGRRLFRELKKIDEQAWREADTRMRGGLLYASGDRLNVHTESRDFEGTVLDTPAKVIAVTGRLPVVRQTLGAIKAYQKAVFGLNRGFERYAQTAVVGKLARRQVREMNGSWLKALRLQEKAAKQVASGLLDTPTQVRFARAIDDVLGKYGRFSPGTRRVIQGFAPFLPWYLNAVKFVGYTLPVKHPVQTALIATAERVFEEEIKAHRRSVPPGSLEATIPLEDGGLLDVARYSPFGAFTNLPGGVVDPLLPQLSSAVGIMEGRSFTGRELQQQSGEPVGRGKRVWLALYSTLESIAPGISIARRAQEGGRTAYDDSTIFAPRTKPGTGSGGAVERILHPFRPTYLSGGPQTGQTPAGGGGPSRMEQLLERRADLLQQNEAAVSRREDLLEKRARLLGG